ncbi:MAG: D-aminoacyl-tRNA deacylase [Polyangia bacterium]
MRAVVQRVSRAEVRDVENQGQVLGRIRTGLCVLLGIGQGDDESDVAWMADKLAGLRVFPDADPKGPNINRNLRDVGGALLVISQFTLYADTSKGRRPSFVQAMPPAQAIPLYERLVQALREAGHPVETGRFGAMMAVELVNDGPVTLWLDSREGRKPPPPPTAPPPKQGAA